MKLKKEVSTAERLYKIFIYVVLGNLRFNHTARVPAGPDE